MIVGFSVGWCWRPTSHSRERRGGFPSWSWASMKGQVELDTPPSLVWRGENDPNESSKFEFARWDLKVSGQTVRDLRSHTIGVNLQKCSITTDPSPLDFDVVLSRVVWGEDGWISLGRVKLDHKDDFPSSTDLHTILLYGVWDRFGNPIHSSWMLVAKAGSRARRLGIFRPPKWCPVVQGLRSWACVTRRCRRSPLPCRRSRLNDQERQMAPSGRPRPMHYPRPSSIPLLRIDLYLVYTRDQMGSSFKPLPGGSQLYM